MVNNIEYRVEVVDYMETWVNSFPDPNQRLIKIDGVELSPAEILEQVKRRTDLGERFYKAHEKAYNEDHADSAR